MSNKYFSIAITVVALIIIAAGFSLTINKHDTIGQEVKGDNAKVVKIGYSGPLTGPVSPVGIPVKNAFALAVNDLSKDSGIRVEVIYEDDKCDPRTAVGIVNKFLDVDKVDFIVNGVCSSSALAMAPITEKARKILFNSLSASPDLTNAGEYVFRVSASSVRNAKTIAAELSKKSIKSIAILAENNPYTIGWMVSLEKAFSQIGGAVLTTERFDPQETELSTHLGKLKESNANALVFIAISTPTVKRTLDAYVKLGLNNLFVGNEGFGYESVLSEYKDELEGNLVATYNIGFESGAWESLKQKYVEQYGSDYQTPYLLTLSYDTFSILHDGIIKCGKDSECMKDFLYTVKNYNGKSGVFSLDEHGDGLHDFVLLKVENGKLIKD